MGAGFRGTYVEMGAAWIDRFSRIDRDKWRNLMSRVRLAMVLMLPFLFAALPLVALLFEPGNAGGPVASVVTIQPDAVAPEPGDAVVPLPADLMEDAEASKALAYRPYAEPQRDCSQGSNPHIAG
jgi:hypothetical protein